MLQHGQITDAEVYYSDKSLVGLCEEFNLPALESTQIEHETLGSIGVLALPRRGLSKLDGSMTLAFPEPEFQAVMSNPTRAVQFQLHSKLDVFDELGLNLSKSTTLVTHVTAMFYKVESPAAKKGEAGKLKADFTLTKFMQRDIKSSDPIVEVDLMFNVYKVNGQPVWPE